MTITDPGSEVEQLARGYAFRDVFANGPNIGGRYSALSFFGLVPATLVGVDIDKLLDRMRLEAVNCDRYNCPASGDNVDARLGAGPFVKMVHNGIESGMMQPYARASQSFGRRRSSR